MTEKNNLPHQSINDRPRPKALEPVDNLPAGVGMRTGEWAIFMAQAEQLEKGKWLPIECQTEYGARLAVGAFHRYSRSKRAQKEGMKAHTRKLGTVVYLQITRQEEDDE